MIPRYSALCCYFGQWPTHFGYWLKSCSFNDGVDFILVTDIPVEGYDIPRNVRIVRKSFEEVRMAIASKFPDIHIALDRPYKLCDFKTAYGFIFEDLFEGYDYWGYYDIDTLWGDILKFIPENSGSRLVKIFPCGHLSFIRNVAPWNRIYELVNQVAGTLGRNNVLNKKILTWQECFSSPENHYYDEEGGLEPLMSALSVPKYSGVDFDNILPAWKFDHFYSINFPEKSHFLVHYFEGGHLYRYYLKGLKPQKEEISYVHFSKRKLSLKDSTLSELFLIYPNSIKQIERVIPLFLLVFGRPRYLSNIVRRLKNRFSSL